MALCYVCKTKLSSGVCIQLDSNICPDDGKKYYEKIDELLGIESFISTTFSEKLCKKCTSLLKRINKLENDMKLFKNNFLLTIKKKSVPSVAEHDKKDLNLQLKEFDKLHITDNGTRITANDNTGCSSLQMLENEKLNSTRSDMQSHFLTKNDKEAIETSAKPSSVTQVVNKQLQPDEELDCDVYTEKRNKTSNDNSLDSALQISKDKYKNENKTAESRILYKCCFCFDSFDDPDFVNYHVCSRSTKRNTVATIRKSSNTALNLNTQQLPINEQIKIPVQSVSSFSMFECGYCKIFYSELEQLTSHMLMHYDTQNDNMSTDSLAQVGKKPEQTEPEQTEPEQKDLQISELDNPGSLYYCNFCSTNYDNLETLRDHECSHTSSENNENFVETMPQPSTSKQIRSVQFRYKCKICYAVYDDSQSCMEHVDKQHMEEIIKETAAEDAEKYGGTGDTEETIKCSTNYPSNNRKKQSAALQQVQLTDEEMVERRKELKKRLALRRRLITARS